MDLQLCASLAHFVPRSRLSTFFKPIPAALSGLASAEVAAAAFPGWLQLKVIKTTNIAKARNDVLDIVDFLLWARS